MTCEICLKEWPDHLVSVFLSNREEYHGKYMDPICALAAMRDVHGDPEMMFQGEMNLSNYAEALKYEKRRVRNG
jgi:hypothetical protein